MKRREDTVVFLAPPIEELTKRRVSRFLPANYTVPTSPWTLFFCKPLEEIFSRVLVYDYMKNLLEKGPLVANDEIVRLVKREHPRYVIWLAGGFAILPSTFSRIRNEGIPVIGIFGEDDTTLWYLSTLWVGLIDTFVTNDELAIEKYHRMGARAIHLLCAGMTGVVCANQELGDELFDVTFVGTKKRNREEWIDGLRGAQIGVVSFGEGWGRRVSYAEMIQIVQSSRINLSFTSGRILGRIFEVVLANAFLLTEYAPGLERYFEIGKEIDCFRNTDELLAKIRYYLSHETERRLITQAGHARAIGSYASARLLSGMIESIERMQGERIEGRTESSETSPYLLARTARWNIAFSMAFLLASNFRLAAQSFRVAVSIHPLRIEHLFGTLRWFTRALLRVLYSRSVRHVAHFMSYSDYSGQ